jgi:hypothetical protein
MPSVLEEKSMPPRRQHKKKMQRARPPLHKHKAERTWNQTDMLILMAAKVHRKQDNLDQS